uniref:Uncharacterized protein n=1 Tax=Amphimedon queenslandica TaxID=400682 RepID=A0A1X7UFV6_AMPQE
MNRIKGCRLKRYCILGVDGGEHESLKQAGSDLIDEWLQQSASVVTQHVPSGRQELCSVHQLQDNRLHVLSRERENIIHGKGKITIILLHISLIHTSLRTGHNIIRNDWKGISSFISGWSHFHRTDRKTIKK